MNLVLDNIVFELQRAGGISKYWAKSAAVLDCSAFDIKYLEGPLAKHNIFRRDLQLRHPIIHDSGPLFLRRVVSPRTPSHVFHSSYYRTSPSAIHNVVTVHDFMNELYPTSWRDWALARVKRRACARASLITVVSHRTKSDMLRMYPWIDPGIIRVIPNGVDSEFYPDPRSGVISNGIANLASKSFWLFVGARGHCKNFPLVCQFLAESLRQGYASPLVLAGGPTLSPSEHLIAKRLGIPDSMLIHWTSPSTGMLRILYSNCISLLIPSIYEGFGLPALEAARCRCVVVAATGSALEEIVGASDYTIDLAKSNEALRVLRLGFDGAHANHERERLYARSLLFDWDFTKKALMEAYGDLQ